MSRNLLGMTSAWYVAAAAAADEPNAGVVALLGSILATSVFTLGLHAHRSHTALLEAKRVIRNDAGERRGQRAHDLVADAGSYLLLLANAALLLLAAIAARVAWRAEFGAEGRVTLVAFVALELVMVLLGGLDHLRVRNALRADLHEAGLHVHQSSIPTTLAAELKARRPAAGTDADVRPPVPDASSSTRRDAGPER